MRWVGRTLPRYEDLVLLRGRGRYTADLARGARMLRFVRSPVARGRILAVNASPGVPIITAAALGEVKPICPRLDRPDFVPVAQPIFARERVNHLGEPIAAVIADTAAEAERRVGCQGLVECHDRRLGVDLDSHLFGEIHRGSPCDAGRRRRLC